MYFFHGDLSAGKPRTLLNYKHGFREALDMRTKEALQLRIIELCNKNDLTLNGLCYLCGITQSTLNNMISGRNNSITVSTVQKICDGLEIDLPTFFDSDLFRNIEQEIY